MSLEQVLIAELGKWFWLDTADIASLIDAVPAHDGFNLSSFCRVDPPSTQNERHSRWHVKTPSERKLKPFEVEWSGTEKEWKERRIDSKQAKLIAEELAERNKEYLFCWHDAEASGKDIPYISNPEAMYEYYGHEIQVLEANDFIISLMVYAKFLDLLSVNCDDAFRHIASHPYRKKADIPEAHDRRFEQIAAEAANGEAQAEADQPPSILPASLPPFSVKNRVSTVGTGNTQVRKTCEENPEAVAHVKARLEQEGARPEEIAVELRARGSGVTVIGCIMKPDCADIEQARNHGKYLLEKASKN